VTSKGHPAPKPKPRPKKHHKKPHKPPAPKPLLVLRTKTSALPNEQDEIGHPALSKSGTTTLASGRLAEWKGTLELIGDRPILGYGFGTEQNVFVDRWYTFQGGTAENSYLGLLLQVGIVGLLLITAIGLALIVGAVRALRVLRGDERVVVAAGLGVLVAAAAIMLIQSYLYSVGNVATGTVWISLFVLGAVALEPAPKTAAASVPAPAHEAAA
jgi:O-antigen ligase